MSIVGPVYYCRVCYHYHIRPLCEGPPTPVRLPPLSAATKALLERPIGPMPADFSARSYPKAKLSDE